LESCWHLAEKTRTASAVLVADGSISCHPRRSDGQVR
jgi:hypothetical protein